MTALFLTHLAYATMPTKPFCNSATGAQLAARGLHALSWDDYRRYPDVESQLLADYGDVLTSPEVKYVATFQDLVFKPHPIGHGAKHAELEFPNGYGVSVVGGDSVCRLYGNGITTFEVAVTHHGVLCYCTPITNDVMGWLTATEVSEVMVKVEALPAIPVGFCPHRMSEPEPTPDLVPDSEPIW